MIDLSPLRRAAGVALLCLVAPSTPVLAQAETTERLGVPGPIGFEGMDYELVWTAQPAADYFKQEYLPEGQRLESYTHMFLIEAVTSPVTPEQAVASMTGGLENRRSSDPVVNYEVINNDATGEIILDFLVSDASSGQTIVEWNAYRYVALGDGIALYAISRRGYGDDGAEEFLTGLRDWRLPTIDALANLEAPPLTPAQ